MEDKWGKKVYYLDKISLFESQRNKWISVFALSIASCKCEVKKGNLTNPEISV